MPRDSNIGVCLISEIFYPEDQGGQGQQAFELARRIAARGLVVQVITRRNFAGSPRRACVDGVDIWRVGPAGLLKGRGWAALPKTLWFMGVLFVRTLLTVRHSDVVLVHGAKAILIPVMLAARLAPRARGGGGKPGSRDASPRWARSTTRAPCIIKIDAIAELQQDIAPESLARMHLANDAAIVRIWRWFRAGLLRSASVIVAISGEIAAELQRRGVDARRIVSLPNGVDLRRFGQRTVDQATLRARLQLPEGLLIVCSGRLAHSKGLPMLLEVWARVAPRHPGARLLLVGSGARSFDDCEAQLRQFAQAQAPAGSVLFAGQVENVADYLHAADLYVLASESEGFGLSLIEAMAAGLPCISTRVGIAPQVIEHRGTGWLVPPRDSSALEAALLEALRDDAARAHAGRAAPSAVAQFDIDAVVDRYITLFEAVVDARRRELQPHAR